MELEEIQGYYIDYESKVNKTTNLWPEKVHKNIWPTKELAEAALSLSQLCQSRDRYNDRWEADWKNTTQEKFIIHFDGVILVERRTFTDQKVLAFKNESLTAEFISNFHELIETAKLLLQ